MKHARESSDWEKVKAKYADILAMFCEQLPSGADAAEELKKDYPHKPITLKCLTAKLRAVQLKYRQAVDSGRSGYHVLL